MKKAILLSILLLLFQYSFALKPENVYHTRPDSMGIEYKEVRLKTNDGFEINTWIYPSKKELDKKIVLIMSGGDAGNMGYFVYQAYMLSQRGFTVITYDYRGFGTSSNFPIDPDYLYYDEFVTDLQTVINYSDSNFKDHKIALFGFSMGTMISGFAAARNDNISFYIADGYIADPGLLISRYKTDRGKTHINLPGNKSEYPSIIRNLKMPFLIFAGTEDTRTTLQDATVAVQQRPHRELIVYDGEHGEAFIKLTASKQTGDRYFDCISGFVDGYLHYKQ